MTEMLYGSRFLGADLIETDAGSRFCDEADAFDNVIEYTPRHLRAATLSRELQEALDAAFAPAYETLDTAFAPGSEPLSDPEPESMPLPEPVPAPARAETEAELAGYPIVPETVEYPAVLPAAATPVPVIPETIFRDAVAAEFVAEPEFVTEPEFVAEPEPGFVAEPEPAFVAEPVIVLPAARQSVPVREHTPVSPTPFPEQEGLAEHQVARAKKRPRRGRRIRPVKVDVSRLMVPTPSRIANG